MYAPATVYTHGTQYTQIFMRPPCAVLQGSPTSHAWGGLHDANYANPLAIEPGGVDPPGADPNQHFIYEFQVLRARAANGAVATSDGRSPGLVLTLTFPVPVVATAVYGGHGAIDLTQKSMGHGSERGYASRGSRTMEIQLCGEARFQGDACPSEFSAGGQEFLADLKFEKLEVQGERRAPLEAGETSTDIMPVNVLCESRDERDARLARLSIPPSPPPPTPPPPLPSPAPPAYSYEALAAELDDSAWANDPRVARARATPRQDVLHSEAAASRRPSRNDDDTITFHSHSDAGGATPKSTSQMGAIGFGARPLSAADAADDDDSPSPPAPPMQDLATLLWGSSDGPHAQPPPPPSLPFVDTAGRDAKQMRSLLRSLMTGVVYLLALGGFLLLVLLAARRGLLMYAGRAPLPLSTTASCDDDPTPEEEDDEEQTVTRGRQQQRDRRSLQGSIGHEDEHEEDVPSRAEQTRQSRVQQHQHHRGYGEVPTMVELD